MNLADKIIHERKKLGLSQEELAEKLSVSRQAVSKWESAQSVPDLERIIAMSELFSVSTDYLLKESTDADRKSSDSEGAKTMRRLSPDDADEYISKAKSRNRAVALGVVLCILSPVVLIILIGLVRAGGTVANDTVAAAIGLTALFAAVAAAVYLFIQCAGMTERYKYIEEGDFEPAFGVSSSINEKRAEYEPTYTKYLSVGIVLLVLSPLPLIISAVTGGSDAVIFMMTALLLCIVALGVYMIVRVSMTKTCYETLTKGSGYEKTRKSGEKQLKAFSGEYWSIALAVYLSWSFISKDWGTTWIVWPIAAVAFVPLTKLAELITGKDEGDSEDDE